MHTEPDALCKQETGFSRDLIWKQLAPPHSLPLPACHPPGSGAIRRGPRTYVIGSGLDLLVQLVLVLVPEGRVAHEQDVEDHPWGEPGTRAHTAAPPPAPRAQPRPEKPTSAATLGHGHVLSGV